MNRRGFLGALAGMPIAAVVVPRVSVPEVTAPPLTTIGYHSVAEGVRPGRNTITVTISCDTNELTSRLEAARRQFESTVGRIVDEEFRKSVRVGGVR